MKYTAEDIFLYMESGRIVRVTDVDGRVHLGQCWAYGSVQSECDYGIREPTLDIEGYLILALSEIEKFEYADDAKST